MTKRLLTVGHGTLAQESFTRLLQQADVASVVDVRRFRWKVEAFGA